MYNLKIDYPSIKYKNYMEALYNYCRKNSLSLILKGSLAKGTATNFSDMDLVILGITKNSQVDEIISIYGCPVMTNFTENPKGILILVYKDNISIDLDLRESITYQDLRSSLVILKYEKNFIVNEEIKRKHVESKYMPNRPDWYKVLRLLHRAVIKYLSNKTDSAYELLGEIKESLILLNIKNLNFNNKFEDDIICIFKEFCIEFDVDIEIDVLFQNLFREFKI